MGRRKIDHASESFMFGGATPWAVKRPNGLIVVPYGGGVNSVASLVFLRRMGIVPRAIVMANPGSERRGTWLYLGRIIRPWCRAVGFPPPVVVSRKSEGRRRPRMERFETLKQECDRIASLPSIAFGKKRCSLKFKRDPQLWWCERQPWARAEWEAGRKLVKSIGYDADESHRIRYGFDDADEHAKYTPWYPLHEAGIDRDGCEELIRSDSDLVKLADSVGVPPVPPKSACAFCASNTLEDWIALRSEDPRAFVEAVEMSRRAAPSIDDTDVVGLMRRSPPGRRQLHVWAEGGYGESCSAMPSDDLMPCECAL